MRLKYRYTAIFYPCSPCRFTATYFYVILFKRIMLKTSELLNKLIK